MSRSGYAEGGDIDNWELIKWRGQVASAIRGKRGQAFLRELIDALDAMPEKKLIAHELAQGGEVCALGSVGVRRGIELETLDPENYDEIADTFGIASQLVQEIEWQNDEMGYGRDSPQSRWCRMRAWAAARLRSEPTP